MGQTGFQGVKQYDVNCGHLKVHDNPFTGQWQLGEVKKRQNNNKLYLTQNWFETCYPD